VSGTKVISFSKFYFLPYEYFLYASEGSESVQKERPYKVPTFFDLEHVYVRVCVRPSVKLNKYYN
jgi:hypothetical protein